MKNARELLRESFGLPDFHPWQREAVDALMSGCRKVLVIAPTGGGKSLCYQFPATVLEGTTVVISPLIALMDDQVRSLSKRGIESTYLASTLDVEERRARERKLEAGHYRLVYVAPERLASERFVQTLINLRPPFVAVDEAHCISQWGHDFRPAYLRLGEVLQRLAPPRVLACTATATPLVRDEILSRLNLDPPSTAVVLRGFSRPNLHLNVVETDRSADRNRALLDTLRKSLGDPEAPHGGAIVYAATRRNTERVAQFLAREGFRADAYHAGLAPTVREQISERFASRALDVVVATNAFGMGIDRPDIRAVVHVQAPGSVEAYYQEVGRAGRDGQPAVGLLMSGASDFSLRRKLLSLDGGATSPDSELQARQWRLFLDLMAYVEAGSCRHDFILRYFGDEQETLGGCGHCDVCMRLEAEREHPSKARELVDQIVRKALSGIARNRGRAGLTAVADMLHGKDTDRLRKLGLTSLSTHGLLADHPAPWVLALLRRLITAGLVDLTATEFPVPFLTPNGISAMRGESPVHLLLPPNDAGRPRSVRKKDSRLRDTTPPPSLSAEDSELFEQLRAARLEMARAKGVPAYVICHDRTLRDIASIKPLSLDQLAGAHGMGPARMDQYGQSFLTVVQGHRQSPGPAAQN